MQRPKLAIFDMDGLIFDSERLFMEKKGVIMREYGYEQRTEDYIRTLGTNGETLRRILLEIYGSDYPVEEITSRTRALVNDTIEREGPRVKHGIRSLLKWYQKHGVPCCVASSTKKEYVRHYLELAGLSGYFQHIIGGDDVVRSKPAPDIFLAACVHFCVSPGQALVLEDSENGILAADAAGIPVICIPDLKMPESAVANRTARVVTNAVEVIRLMDECEA